MDNASLKCEYSLSSSGKDFIKIIRSMKKWALKWKFNNKICENAACKECNL
ncbi:MAG: winged helix-turn-helix transcriptional regulator [archaeon]